MVLHLEHKCHILALLYNSYYLLILVYIFHHFYSIMLVYQKPRLNLLDVL